MRGKIITVIIFLLVVTISTGVYASDGMTIKIFNSIKGISINGEKIDLENEVFVYNNKAYAPLRLVAEELGYQVEYDNMNNTINLVDSKISKIYPSIFTVESYCGDGDWDAFKGGCSWYCAAQIPDLIASSELNDEGQLNYIAKNAHDFNLETVWAEGVEGFGIGESIRLVVPGNQFRLGITNFEIINGYIKTKVLWEENSRVKKMMVYKNEIPYKILYLDDCMDVQSFEVGCIPLSPIEDVILDFEILEVYPGTKYEDTVITELQLDGVGDH